MRITRDESWAVRRLIKRHGKTRILERLRARIKKAYPKRRPA